MKKDISRGKMTQEDADRTRSLLKAVKGIEEFGNVDLAIEVSWHFACRVAVSERTANQ